MDTLALIVYLIKLKYEINNQKLVVYKFLFMDTVGSTLSQLVIRDVGRQPSWAQAAYPSVNTLGDKIHALTKIRREECCYSMDSTSTKESFDSCQKAW